MPIGTFPSPNHLLENRVVAVTDEKRTKAELLAELRALRERNALLEQSVVYKGFFDNATQAFAALVTPGRISEVNSAFASMFGYSNEEASGLAVADIVAHEDVNSVEEQMAALFRAEMDYSRIEKPYRRKDGSLFWGDLTLTSIPGPGKRVDTIVAVIADVSETKRAQEALQERDALISALYDKAAQAIASTDHQGRFIEVNPAFERMFGYNRREVLALTHLDITPPEFMEISREKADALFGRQLDSYRIEKRYLRKDGSVFWADVTIGAIHKPDGRVNSVAVVVDISDRKRAEEALQKAHDELEIRVLERTAELAEANERLKREIAERARTQEALKKSEERLRTIFETAKDCIFIKDRNLRYALVNPAMEALLELPGEEIMQRTDHELFGVQTGNYLSELELRVLSGDIVETEQTRPVRGVPMTFLDIRAPMRSALGEIVGICGISRNITERAQTISSQGTAVDDAPSSAMRATLTEARMAARTDVIVLLTGESGAGKDHLARYIHTHSRRANGPFYAINCAAIPQDLAESELFGHEPGAFTGANRRKRGLLELAEGGTLLLNEIGELPLHLQAKLLTFLDTRSFTRVGGEISVTVSARVIAATNRHLAEEVTKGRFREDLYYRLNVLSIRLPPLRKRTEDLPILVEQIVVQLTGELQLATTPSISADEMEKLKRYQWPGNVRELRNVLERAVIVSDGRQLKFDFVESDAPDSPRSSWTVHFPPQPSLIHAIAQMRRNLIEEALSKANGNKQQASRLLGVSRFVLRRQMKTLGMNVRK
jgi:sigma-54 dependent transcriptional regulator, acetoin dehydrogenase operon transcriptional activator AcoR